MAGHGQVGVHQDSARTIQRGAERGVELPAECRGLHAGRPEHRAGVDPAPTELQAVLADIRDGRTGEHGDPQCLKLCLGTPRQCRRKGAEDPLAALDQQHLGGPRIAAAEITDQGVSGDLGQRAGQLHAGRPATHHDEGQQGGTCHRVILEFRPLECQQDPRPDGQRVVQGLEAGGVRLPAGVAEIGVGRAGGQYQVIVGKAPGAEPDVAFLDIEPGDRAEQNGGIALPPQDVTQRGGDGRRREAGCRHLVEQGLEDMVVGPVDERHVHRVVPQGTGRPEAGKSATDHHHTWQVRLHGEQYMAGLLSFAAARRPRKNAMPPESAALFHVIDPRIFDRAQLDDLCDLTNRVRLLAKHPDGARFLLGLLPDRRAMLYFVQPSTRTFLSFNNACHVLGIRTSEIRDPSTSSEVKGESFEDSIRTFSSYVDVIIMRTPRSGEAARAADLMNRIPRPVPVINAGSGQDQHPTQALLDIYTLDRSFEERGGIDGKVIGLMGDLKRGRTVRSLCYLMKNYRNVRLVLIAPPRFDLEPDIKDHLREQGIPFTEGARLDEVLPSLDAIYVTRMQSEWDTAGETRSIDYGDYSITPDNVGRLKPDAVIMHPLPRGPEISPAIDENPRAMYWRQERNGMWMRAAILLKIFKADRLVRDFDVAALS